MPARAIREGDELDGFRIGGRLHQGGMAVLWEATHPAHAFPLLVKVPLLGEGTDPAGIVSFEMEQMILPRLNGPHVPRFAGAGGFDARPYLAMERIAGPPLKTPRPEEPWPLPQVVETGARVADALEALHRQHVVHLDVKPSNLLMRDTGEAVLIDFGLSHHQQLPDLMEEEFRLPYGTGAFMAPEQVMGIRSDPRSDLFALGAMLYLFTTGAFPFGDPQHLSAVKRRLWRDPQPPRRLRADCPPWLQEIILRCLEILPERRHPTAAQLAFDLRHPDHVALTARAGKVRQDSLPVALRRRFARNREARFAKPAASMEEAGAAAPIVAVAVDFDETDPALANALRRAVAQTLAVMPGARLACVNVLRQHLLAADTTLDAAGNNKHVQRLVELRHWAAPLKLPDDRVTFHVLEALSPAGAILDHARVNGVDHIVMGARASSLRRRLLGSVSAEVAAEAPCSVTVVRARGR
jgi:nucleotide-binding universal stress UspA family protein